MKTFRNKEDIQTYISDNDRKTLSQIIELLRPLVKVEPIGDYAFMNAEKVWLTLIVQVCVMGSARLIERLIKDPIRYENFQKEISLATIKNQPNPVIYIAQILQKL